MDNLYFIDVNGLFMGEDSSLIGTETGTGYAKGLYERDKSSYDRYGSDYTYDFKKYGIDIFKKDSGYYIPISDRAS